MKLTFGFGTGYQEVTVPEHNFIGELHANEVPVGLTGEAEVIRALHNPIGTPRLKDLVHPGETVAIVTSDVTRPMPTWKVMPALLDELYAAGIRKEDITLVFGLGSHRKQTPEEHKKLAGERAFREIRCVDSDPEDCISLGTTSRGTPVDITRVVAEADRRICLGNIEYHYFAGYSGGVKAIMPGVSTRAAIQANHSRMVLPECCAGAIDTNPLRLDIEEAGAMLGVDFIVNVVLSEHKEILCAVAGDPVKAHREGCKFLDKLYRKELKEPADIVLVSQGGAPKDLNLYQTQKALDNAKHAVKDGGVIILIGSCKEGMGEKTFEEWMTTAPTPESLIERIGRDFKLGGHKAAAIAMVLQKAEIDLVSDLDDDFVRSIFLTPQPSAQAALDHAFEKLGKDATVLAMPYGGSTLPSIMKN
ncbi:MAG: nickel-dependent lactate racemase [Lachnospiraceae bacterium]|nr:nickel-dependent lactate racemase [Clostridia bacterium]MBR4169558.1 nickel-dependent lactate racemase [Lachnospiraceae bacterium]